jgi:hypothetical protein
VHAIVMQIVIVLAIVIVMAAISLVLRDQQQAQMPGLFATPSFAVNFIQTVILYTELMRMTILNHDAVF